MSVKSTRAQSTVEFALILPVFLVLTLLIIQFGLVVKTQIVLAHSTREGARAVISHLSNEDVNYSSVAVQRQVQKIAQRAVFKSADLDPQKTQVTLKKAKNNLLEIKVSHKISLLIPLTDNFLSNIRLSSSLSLPIS